jgi:hypothetical protein
MPAFRNAVAVAPSVGATAPAAHAAASAPFFTALPASGATELQSARARPAAAALPDGKILVAGGNNGNQLRTAELFDPASETFTALPASGDTELSVARSGAAAAPLTDGKVLARAAALPDGAVLIMGGFDGSGVFRSAELYEPAPEAQIAGGDLGSQTVGQPSAVQTLVVDNLGAQALTLAGASVTCADVGDFAVTDDRCSGRRLAFGRSCTISVRVTPSVAGARSATLTLQDNEPAASSSPLSGAGVAGAEARGTPGPPGPPGPAGKVKLVMCHTVTKRVKVHGHPRKHRIRRCGTRRRGGSHVRAGGLLPTWRRPVQSVTKLGVTLSGNKP